MRGKAIGCACAALASLLAVAGAAGAASLPAVKGGQRPGPPLLYAAPPHAPQLENLAPFRAEPLLISGAAAYRDGEFLYQDYLFDDHGADTVPTGSLSDDPISASKTGGDVRYPTGERYANNAADLVELRINPERDAIVYRVTLGTVKAPDTTVVGIGIDTDRAGDVPVPWPRGAGVTSPGLDRFITAWGEDGEVTTVPGGASTRLPAGSVTIDAERNQMTIRVPRSLMDPGTATWRYVAGTGLWSGTGWRQPMPGDDPGEDDPASGGPLPAAGVYNLAFRFDEPQMKANQPPYTTFPGVGNWFEDKQAYSLGRGTTGDFHADVDFARLAREEDGYVSAPPPRAQARIFASRLGVPEGVKDDFPEYGGQLQPYILTTPSCAASGRRPGFTFALHSLGGTYTQFAVFSPNQLVQLGEERCSYVATPLAYGQDGWYTDEGEADVFEVWADVARKFELDPDNVALSGYSMGGYGTYKLGVEYPDLWGKAFTVVGPPGRWIWVPPNPPTDGQDTNSNPLLANVRWVPFMNWVASSDELVPYAGVREQQATFDRLGLRSQLWTFTPAEHYTLAVEDQWEAGRAFLSEARVRRDPWRVDYAFFPSADRPALGLLHDHAYWVSGLRARDTRGDRQTSPALGQISARSLAFGEADPRTGTVADATPGAGPAALTSIEGTEWTRAVPASPRNELRLDLQNVSAARIAGRRARLNPRQPLTVRVKSDGPGNARLGLRFPRGTRVTAIGGGARRGDVTRDRRGATIVAPSAGERSYRFVPPAECVDRRKFRFRIHQPAGGRVVEVRAFVNGRRVQTRRATRVRRLVLRRLPRGVFRVRIVSITNRGDRLITVRRYRGCRKGKPTGRRRGPRRS